MTKQEISSLIYATAFGEGMPANMCTLIVAQSKHETADFTSNAFIKNNNGFGYKYVPGGKYQSGAGITSTEHDPYAKYDSLENSVKEICAWIRRREHEMKFPADLSSITTPTQYATLLKQCGYFGDPVGNYIAGLTHYLNNVA